MQTQRTSVLLLSNTLSDMLCFYTTSREIIVSKLVMLRTQIFEVEPNTNRTYSYYNEPEPNRTIEFKYGTEPNFIKNTKDFN